MMMNTIVKRTTMMKMTAKINKKSSMMKLNLWMRHQKVKVKMMIQNHLSHEKEKVKKISKIKKIWTCLNSLQRK